MTNSSISLIKSRMRIPAICAPMFLVTGPQMVIRACKSGASPQSIFDTTPRYNGVISVLGRKSFKWRLYLVQVLYEVWGQIRG